MADEKESVGTELVPAHGMAASGTVTAAQLEEMGLMMPVVDPAALRAAFAERQKLLTSILDPDRDFLYNVRFTGRDGKQQSSFTERLSRAQELATQLNGEWSAHPKKSGCLKLAHALGIESKRVEVTGLPVDQRVKYSSCRYVARHRRTGREEEGQGYCDDSEKGGKMAAHAIISMADTRAYCHAVLRCAGYDNVGADSMVFDDNEAVTVITHERPPVRERPAFSSEPARTIVDEMPPERVPERQVAKPPVEQPPVEQKPAEQKPAEPESPNVPTASLITNAMAAELSTKLLSKLGSKEKARAWLKENAGVERSIHIQEDQVGSINKMIDALEVP